MTHRRSFLKRVGAAALTVVTAPLFVPSDRLDFGVPRRQIIVPESEIGPIYGGTFGDDTLILYDMPLTVYPPLDGRERRSVYTYRVESSLPGIEWRRVNATYAESSGMVEIRMDA